MLTGFISSTVRHEKRKGAGIQDVRRRELLADDVRVLAQTGIDEIHDLVGVDPARRTARNGDAQKFRRERGLDDT